MVDAKSCDSNSSRHSRVGGMGYFYCFHISFLLLHLTTYITFERGRLYFHCNVLLCPVLVINRHIHQ